VACRWIVALVRAVNLNLQKKSKKYPTISEYRAVEDAESDTENMQAKQKKILLQDFPQNYGAISTGTTPRTPNRANSPGYFDPPEQDVRLSDEEDNNDI